jgi:hypothetical protein
MSPISTQQIAGPRSVLFDASTGSVGPKFTDRVDRDVPPSHGTLRYVRDTGSSVGVKPGPITQAQLQAVLKQIDALMRQIADRASQKSIDVLATPVLDAYMKGFRAAFGAQADLSIRPVQQTESVYELVVKLLSGTPDDADALLSLEEQAMDRIKAEYPESLGQLAVRYIYSE